MTQRNYTIQDVEMLISRGRLARSRAMGEAVAHAAAAIDDLFGPALAAVKRRVAHFRAVRELRGMDARMLADIGLTRGEIELAAAGKLPGVSAERPRQRAANESVSQPLRATPKAA